jgi:hypothetical protein
LMGVGTFAHTFFQFLIFFGKPFYLHLMLKVCFF